MSKNTPNSNSKAVSDPNLSERITELEKQLRDALTRIERLEQFYYSDTVPEENDYPPF